MTAAMGRIARRVGSAVAAMLLAAGVVAWPVGFRRTVALAAFGPEGRPIAVFSSSGAFHLLIATVPTGPAMAWRLDGRTDSRESFDQRRDQIVTAADWRTGDRVVTPTGPAGPTTTVAHGRLGLAAGGGRDVLGQPGTWFAYATLPAWLVVAGLAVVPVRDARRLWRRWHWTRAGACPNCGYDLLGSTDRCPECGRPLQR